MHSLTQKITLLAAAVLLAGLAVGCSPQSRKASRQARADKFFDAGQYPQAEVEYLNVLKLDQKDAHAIGRLAIIYFDDGRLTRAYPYLINAVELTPNEPAARLRMGFIHLLEGKIREARADANIVLDHDPKNEEAPLLLIQSLRTPADVKEARQRIESLQQTGETASLQVALGGVLLRENNRVGAEEAFKHAIALDPKSTPAHSVLGAYYLANNDLEQGEAEVKLAASLSPPRSNRRLEYIDFKLKTGAVGEAQNLLTEMTRSVPDYLPAWIKLAQVALTQKHFGDCESLVGNVLARDPGNYDALSLRGALLLARGETDQAITELERLNSLYLRSPQARYNLALAYFAKGDTSKALKCATDAAALDANFDDAVLLQAQLNLRRDNASAAISTLTQLLRRRPQLGQASLLLAAAQGAQGNLDDALATYRRLGELYPQDPQVPLLIGTILSQQGKTNEARQAFERSVAVAPGYLPAVEQLVNLDLGAKQDGAALSRVQTALEKSPESPQLQVLLARVFNSQTNTDRSEQALKRAIELNGSYEPAYLLLARLYASTKQNEQALERLKGMVARDPRNVEALMLMGIIQNDQQNFAAARDTYEKLLAINPNSSPALNNLAYLYSEKFNLLDKAYEAARRARELLPYDPYSADTLGWILFKRGEYTWAIGLLQESVEKLLATPEIPEVQLQEVLFHLGMTYYMLDDEARAQKALKRAVAGKEIFPGKDEAARRLAWLAIDAGTAGPEAQALLETRVKEQPDDPVALGRLAAIHQRQGAPEKAVRAYELALKQNPKNARLAIELARLYSEQLHDPQKALALAKDAYKLAPDDAEISHALGRLAFAAGEFKWALSLLEKSTQKQVADPGLSFDLALAYYSVGRVTDAEAEAAGALQVDEPFTRADEVKQFLDLISLPGNPAAALVAEPRAQEILRADPTNVPALMVLGAAAEKRGDTETAGTAYEMALQHYPDFVPAMRQLAILLAEKPGGEQRAYEWTLKARESLTQDLELAKALGIIYYRRGEFHGAVQLLGESSRNASPDSKALFYLGMAHYRLKESGESKAALQKALALNLPDAQADEARRVLAELK